REDRQMSGCNLALLGACMVVAAAVAARAELDVVIANGDTVRGSLLPADEAETFRFACPEGAPIRLSLVASGPGLTAGARPFAAEAGVRVTFSLAAPHGSAAAPSIVRVRASDGTTFPLAAGLRTTWTAPATDSYVLTYENTAAADGDVLARARIRQPLRTSR